jgi:hypothetical protein
LRKSSSNIEGGTTKSIEESKPLVLVGGSITTISHVEVLASERGVFLRPQPKTTLATTIKERKEARKGEKSVGGRYVGAELLTK